MSIILDDYQQYEKKTVVRVDAMFTLKLQKII